MFVYELMAGYFMQYKTEVKSTWKISRFFIFIRPNNLNFLKMSIGSKYTHFGPVEKKNKTKIKIANIVVNV